LASACQTTGACTSTGSFVARCCAAIWASTTTPTIWCGPRSPGCAPPNWLTLLHPSYVEQLGGAEGFPRLEQLGLGIELHHWPEGLLIQAGPRPLLGDVNAGESVEAYRAVARVLRPLRAPGPHTWIDKRPREEADEWYARFD
jgi:hypothetical protein